MTPDMSVPAQPDLGAPIAYTICIDARQDGTFTVEMETGPHEKMESAGGEPGGEAGGEMAGDMGGPPASEPEILDTFEEALKAAVRIHQANPVENSPQANFSAGFEGENMKGYA